MPALASICGGFAVHSRIAELRKRGLRIVNETRQVSRYRKLSFYKLEVAAA